MIRFVGRVISCVIALPRRARLAVGILLHTARYLREDRPALDAASRVVGLPYDPAPSRVLLWQTLRALPQTIREHEAQFVETQRRFDDAEPFLRVARLDAPASYSWQGAATVAFRHRSIPGLLTVRWDGLRISGNLQHHGAVRDGLLDLRSNPGLLRGSDALGTVDLPGAVVDGISGDFASYGGSAESSFIARRLTLTEKPGAEGFHRYCFRGGRLRGWGIWTERVASRTAKRLHYEQRRDSFELRMFGRRTRITQVHEDENDQREQVLGVTIEGAPLGDREERLLWLVLSFVAGNRVQPITVEHFDAAATRTQLDMLGTVDYGERANGPPFDLRITEPTFAAPDFARLMEGFGAMEDTGYPIAEALHHLHDANTGYTQVELKNLLFCIHTLFERWADQFDQREIISKKEHDLLRKQLYADLDLVFGAGTKIREASRARCGQRITASERTSRKSSLIASE
jgi:hypothetical protein